MKKVLVAGATGYLGRFVVKASKQRRKKMETNSAEHLLTQGYV